MSDPWIKVWLQGGPVGDWHYMTLVEPPNPLHVMPVSAAHGGWMRVLEPEPGVTHTYARESGVEQFDFERIYYPVTP